uniref:Ras-related GTP-binding protein n=1 Tax=Mus spicilegus TaxID=10103 RepID=A0A8C6H1V0_MUSSI
MSQVLGKPQGEDGGDDEEEDELVGLAGYEDGPESSDAELDSGPEEGESRRNSWMPRSWCSEATRHECWEPGLWRSSHLLGIGGGWRMPFILLRRQRQADFFLDFSDPFSTEVKPRILLMGLRRSGKSSIQKVVFHKMSPSETLFLESTNRICREDVSNSSFVNFQIWDFPGQIDFFDPTFDYEMIFRGTGALIFVIDSQDDYMEALARLHLTVTRAYKVNTDINFEVFIHKVDGLSDDHKIETQRDIHQRANDDLADAGLEKIHLSFYLTSIYDHSIFEAFSKVVQKLIPQLPTLENLLNIFISNSGIEKAFLFDVVSKIYIATDSTPVDMQTYELCCDMIDVVIDISCIYGLKEDGAGAPYDKDSTAIIKLNNTTVLYLKEVTKFLALVCFVREESFERKGLIDYNFHCFRKAIHEVFEVRMKMVKSRKAQSRLPKKTGATPNGTPRVLL